MGLKSDFIRGAVSSMSVPSSAIQPSGLGTVKSRGSDLCSVGEECRKGGG